MKLVAAIICVAVFTVSCSTLAEDRLGRIILAGISIVCSVKAFLWLTRPNP